MASRRDTFVGLAALLLGFGALLTAPAAPAGAEAAGPVPATNDLREARLQISRRVADARAPALGLVATERRRAATARLDRDERVVADARARLRVDDGAGYGRGGGWTPLGYDGVIHADDDKGWIRGSLFGGRRGSRRGRYLYGDIDLTHRRDFGTTLEVNTTLSAERRFGPRALMGGYVGSAAGNSRIAGALEGSAGTVGVNAGAYAVQRLSPGLLMDGFATVSHLFHSLDLSGEGLEITDSYQSTAVQFGGAIRGSAEFAPFTFRPELEFRHRVVRRAGAAFRAATGAGAMTMSLAGRTARSTRLSFEPKVIRYLDPAQRRAVVLSSHASCRIERFAIHTETCGGGVGLGYESSFADGRAWFAAEADVADLGADPRRRVELELSYDF